MNNQPDIPGWIMLVVLCAALVMIGAVKLCKAMFADGGRA